MVLANTDTDFAFGTTTSRRVPARRRAADPAAFRFSEAFPVKRAKDAAFGRDKDSGTLALTSDRDHDDAMRVDPGDFEFSTEPRKARKIRRGAAAGKSCAEQAAMAPLAVAPLAVAGASESKPSGGDVGTARHEWIRYVHVQEARGVEVRRLPCEERPGYHQVCLLRDPQAGGGRRVRICWVRRDLGRRQCAGHILLHVRSAARRERGFVTRRQR